MKLYFPISLKIKLNLSIIVLICSVFLLFHYFLFIDFDLNVLFCIRVCDFPVEITVVLFGDWFQTKPNILLMLNSNWNDNNNNKKQYHSIEMNILNIKHSKSHVFEFSWILSFHFSFAFFFQIANQLKQFYIKNWKFFNLPDLYQHCTILNKIKIKFQEHLKWI